MTLATCKPGIRNNKTITEGDYVVAFLSTSTADFGEDADGLLYVGKVTSVVPVETYYAYNDDRRPDKIYSLVDGELQHNGVDYHEEAEKQTKDKKGNVLVFEEYTYWDVNNETTLRKDDQPLIIKPLKCVRGFKKRELTESDNDCKLLKVLESYACVRHGFVRVF